MKVFISHSSRADPFAKAVSEAVLDGLRGAGHKVFLDTDGLAPGDMWRAVLYDWLFECDAAVILLNGEALGSDWVHREVDILMARRALGTPLRIVPAIMGDLNISHLREAGFGELAEVEVARLREDGAGQPVDPEAVRLIGEQAEDQPAPEVSTLAGEVVAAIGVHPPPDPGDSPHMAKWLEDVALLLGDVRSMDRLVEAARELNVPEASLKRIRDPHAGCRFLAHHVLVGGHGLGLSRAMAKIEGAIPVDSLRRLVGKVAPTWVDRDAARILLELDPGQPQVALLNTDRQRTGEDYVNRATYSASTGFRCGMVMATATEAFLQEFEDDCAKEVAEMLGVEPAEIDWALAYVEDKDRDVLFLIVDPDSTPPGLVAEGVRAVHHRFPWLRILLLSGETLPSDADLAAWRLPAARKVLPALGPKDKLVAKMLEKQLAKLLDNGSQLRGAA